ncbi:MAG: UDP-N-acetylmuramate--L-alanine ligase [Acidimicrobiales bacterium]
MFAAGTSVHILGIGGAGMSGVARLLVERGCGVSGCDVADSPTLHELETAGVRVFRGHDVTHVEGADVVLWSPAIAATNAELTRARERGARLLSRSELLGELASRARVLGLTGTNGKTTATSMLVCASVAAGRDDARLLGAPVRGVGANGHWADGDLILEVDESFGSFAHLTPFALGVLNVEADHLDHYGTLSDLEASFRALIQRTTGPVVLFDEPGNRRVAEGLGRDVVFVGFDDTPWRVSATKLERDGARFDLEGPDEAMTIRLAVTGRHNVANAAVVAVLCRSLGFTRDAVIEGLARFRGVARRFDRLGTWRGAEVIEDYAHLPGEVRATIEACVASGYERIGVVFQPHRYTRTQKLAQDFAGAFAGCALLVVTDVYGAGEENPSGVTGELVANAVRESSPPYRVHYAATFEDVAALLDADAHDLDALLLLGAGDVAGIAPLLSGGVVS